MSGQSVPPSSTVPGIRSIPTDDPTAVELRLLARAPGLTDGAILADFALGAALRARLGPGQRLPTITLTVEIEPARLSSGTSVRSWAEPVHLGLGRSHGVFLHGGERIGHCSATFAVPQRGTDLEPLPWEVTQSAPPADGAEPAAAEAVFARACSTDGETATVLQPIPALLNRSGSLQGGVLFRLAASLSRDDARMVSGHVQFLAVTEADQPVTVDSHPTGETRRTLFVHSLVRQQDRLLAAGSFLFRKGAA